jgi:gentisate 1,2-dioxygenase
MKKILLAMIVLLFVSILLANSFETGWYRLRWPDGSMDQIAVYPNNMLQWHVNGKPTSQVLYYTYDPSNQKLTAYWRLSEKHNWEEYATYKVIYKDRANGGPAIYMYYYSNFNKYLLYEYIGK